LAANVSVSNSLIPITREVFHKFVGNSTFIKKKRKLRITRKENNISRQQQSMTNDYLNAREFDVRTKTLMMSERTKTSSHHHAPTKKQQEQSEQARF